MPLNRFTAAAILAAPGAGCFDAAIATEPNRYTAVTFTAPSGFGTAYLCARSVDEYRWH